MKSIMAVSYTHLDVYKRQELSIRESSTVEKITNGSILVWDTKGIRTIEPTTISNGLDDIYEDGYYAGLQSGWQDMYASYNISLTKDYERLTTEQKAATVFENLVDVDGLKKITGTSGAVAVSYTHLDVYKRQARCVPIQDIRAESVSMR